LNQAAVFELIKDQTWIYEVVNEENNPVRIIYGKQGNGFLMINFHADGTLTFPVNLAWYPVEFRRWTFDEAAQMIVFANQNGVPTLRAHLPVPNVYDSVKMVIENTTNRFVSMPNVNRAVAVPPATGEADLICLPAFVVDDLLQKWLGWQSATLYPMHDAPSWFAKLADVAEYLATHPAVKNVTIINQRIENRLSMPKTALGLRKNTDGSWRMDAMMGERAVILELLNTVLITANLQTDSVDEAICFNQVIQTKFANRVSALDEEEIPC
jgi:hypothetical protein